MASSITTPTTIPDTSQYILSQHSIQQNTIKCFIFGEENSFLPIAAINALATHENIREVVDCDSDLKKIYFPDHSRSFLAYRVYKHAQKLFVVAVAENLGMLFLRDLLRGERAVDEYLPLDMNTRVRDENDVSWSDVDTQGFLSRQKVVCAPIFIMGSYNHSVGRQFGLPIVEARRLAGEKDDEREVYEVKFHDEYLRPSESAEPGEELVPGRMFLMRRFANRGEATNDESFAEAVFGFSFKGMYYLVSNP